MDLGTFIEQLEDVAIVWDPEVYIRIGSHYVKVNKIEYRPETDDEEEAIIIS